MDASSDMSARFSQIILDIILIILSAASADRAHNGPQHRRRPLPYRGLRSLLTRNIGASFVDVPDEVRASLSDNILLTEDWIKVPAFKTVLQIVSESVNRMFTDLPFCRNQDYLKINVNFMTSVVACAKVNNLFPPFLKPIIGSILTPRWRAISKMEKSLGQIIRDWLYAENLNDKDWRGKPNAWFLNETTGVGERRTVLDLVPRCLF